MESGIFDGRTVRSQDGFDAYPVAVASEGAALLNPLSVDASGPSRASKKKSLSRDARNLNISFQVAEESISGLKP